MYELNDDDLAEAIGDTEREIFGEASGGVLPDELEDNDQLIEDMSRVDDWAGRPISDARLAGESTGDTPLGMSMGEIDGEDAEAIQAEAYQRGADAMFRELQPHLPRPQRPDMFADPEGWEANLIAQARGGGMPPPTGYGASPYAKPDMFADPVGYENWLLAEARRQSGVNHYNNDRINSSMAAAHREYGPEFESAYRDLSQGLDPNNPNHRQMVTEVLNSPDPGMALMNAANIAHAANRSAVSLGSAPFARGLMVQRAPLRNTAGYAPSSRDEAIEQSIFNDATSGLDNIWGAFR